MKPLKTILAIFLLSVLNFLPIYAQADTVSSRFRYRWLLEPAYEHADPFSEGLAAVTLYDGRGNRYHGYIDTLGDWVIPHTYMIALGFSEGCAVVEDYEGKRGMINTSGEVVIPIQYEALGPFDQGLAYFKLGNTEGFLDHAGDHRIASDLWSFRPFEEDLAVAYRYETEEFNEGADEEITYWTYITREGHFLFDEIQAELVSDFFGHERAAALMDGKVGYIDRGGHWVIGPRYDYGFPFHEGLAMVTVDGKSGFIDTAGKMVIEPRFDKAYSFSEGLARGIADGYEGFMDKNGTWVIPPIFEDAQNFQAGLAWVTPPGNRYCGLIDQSGKWVFPPISLYHEPIQDGIVAVYMDGKWGYIIIEPIR